jgi:hypothetical protein
MRQKALVSGCHAADVRSAALSVEDGQSLWLTRPQDWAAHKRCRMSVEASCAGEPNRSPYPRLTEQSDRVRRRHRPVPCWSLPFPHPQIAQPERIHPHLRRRPGQVVAFRSSMGSKRSDGWCSRAVGGLDAACSSARPRPCGAARQEEAVDGATEHTSGDGRERRRPYS